MRNLVQGLIDNLANKSPNRRLPGFLTISAPILITLFGPGCKTMTISADAAEDVRKAELLREFQPQTYEFERRQAEADRDSRQSAYGTGRKFY